jgi:hypothetical protein
MGTWGVGAFENDDALDWVAELEETLGFNLIERSLDQVNELLKDDYLEAPLAANAVAAAEVLAAIAGRGRADLPAEVRAWLEANTDQPTAKLLRIAAKAVKRVGANSELAELWEPTEHAAAWQAQLDDLRERLG